MTDPWTIPVPVRPSSFTALREDHRAFNLEVALERIGAYRGRVQVQPDQDLLHCEFQLNLNFNHAGRLGGGRAGVYRAHHLKGVGRTLLAGNWNSEDLYHNSGILLTSGAIREYLVSGLVAAHGHPQLVTPCRGILVRTLPEQLREHAHSVFECSDDGSGVPPAPVDTTTQAISVKPSGFARMSNFVWWLNQVPFFRPDGDDRVAECFEALSRALAGPESAAVAPSTPDAIARRLAERFSRFIDRLQAAWSLGIDWGSVHNNYSLDGRFLDLEMPTVFSSAALGLKVETKYAKSETVMLCRPAELVGFVAPLRCATEMRLFIAWLRNRLTFMMANLPSYGLEREFVACFLEELDEALSEAHPLGSPEALALAIIDPIATTLDLSRATRRDFERLLWPAVRSVFPGQVSDEGPLPELRLRRVDTPPLARTESDTRYTAYVPDAIHDACSRVDVLNTEFNRYVEWADGLRDPDALLAYLDGVTFGQGTQAPTPR